MKSRFVKETPQILQNRFKRYFIYEFKRSLQKKLDDELDRFWNMSYSTPTHYDGFLHLIQNK